MMDWYDGSGHMESGSWLGMGLTMTLIAVLLVGSVVLMIRWLGGGRAVDSPQPDAIAILDERFARGELDAEEYEPRRSALHLRL